MRQQGDELLAAAFMILDGGSSQNGIDDFFSFISDQIATAFLIIANQTRVAYFEQSRRGPMGVTSY